MSAAALISVIIPTFDRSARLAAAIESVLDQEGPLELIVVDDGSTDGTASVVGGFGERLRYERRDHRGVSAARNHGVRMARGSWIAFLDSDDEWLPGKLAAQRRYHAQHRDVPISQTGEIWIRDGVRVNPCKHHAKPSGDVFVPSLERCLVSPSAVLLRRDLFVAAGGFDESLPVCEDYDLWLRLALRQRFGLVREPLMVKYGGHRDQLSRQYWGMDRFRVAALEKLLADPVLVGERRAAAVEVLERKCRVLAKGARRRGREADADGYERLIARYRDD